MLTMCSDEHFPIIYETNSAPKNILGEDVCPLCHALGQIEKLQEEIKKIELQIIKKTHSENFDRFDDVKLNLE